MPDSRLKNRVTIDSVITDVTRTLRQVIQVLKNSNTQMVTDSIVEYTPGEGIAFINAVRFVAIDDPLVPRDGMMWLNGTDLKFRIGGVTKTVDLT